MILKEKINFALLGVLWFLASMLGMCFFINTAFNFNILSTEHWQYLSTLQASGESINIWFYISLFVCISIIVIGLYIITISINQTKKTTKQETEQPQPIIKTETKPEKKYLPPHLNIPRNINISNIQNIIKSSEEQQNAQKQEQENIDEVLSILSNAGYINKPLQTYNNKKYIISIGYNETLWLGGVNTDYDYIADIQTKLNETFNETLNDIEISINAFVISNKESNSENILHFSNTTEFENYISEHPNTNSEADDSTNEFAQYIDVVLQYIRNQ